MRLNYIDSKNKGSGAGPVRTMILWNALIQAGFASFTEGSLSASECHIRIRAGNKTPLGSRQLQISMNTENFAPLEVANSVNLGLLVTIERTFAEGLTMRCRGNRARRAMFREASRYGPLLSCTLYKRS